MARKSLNAFCESQVSISGLCIIKLRWDNVKIYQKKEATVSFTFLGMAGLMVKQRLRVTRLM